MNESKLALVVNEEGCVVDYDGGKALVEVKTGEMDGKPIKIPFGYTLREGERLIYTDYKVGMYMKKPRWNGTSWEETAPQKEIEENNPPVVVPMSKLDVLEANVEYIAMMTGLEVNL